MNDQDRAILSAWMDGEATLQEESYVLDRLLEDPEWQEVYLRWQALRQQIRNPAVMPVERQRPVPTWKRWGWPALAMAASVTLALVLWSQTSHDQSGSRSVPIVADRVVAKPGQAEVAVVDAANHNVFPSTVTTRPVADDQRLQAYLLQHLASHHAQLGSELVNMAPVVTVGSLDDPHVRAAGQDEHTRE